MPIKRFFPTTGGPGAFRGDLCCHDRPMGVGWLPVAELGAYAAAAGGGAFIPLLLS